MPSQKRSKRRLSVPVALILALPVLLAGLAGAGVSRGEVDGLARSVGEVVDRAADMGRDLVESDDQGGAQESASEVSRSIGEASEFGRAAFEPAEASEAQSSLESSSTPGALAFSEPDAADAEAAAPGIVASGEPTPAATTPAAASAPPATTVVPRTPQAAPEAPKDDSTGPAATTAPVPTESAPEPSTPAAVAVSTAGAHIVGTDGRIRGGALNGRSFGDAIQSASPGEQFLFESGNHAPIHVDGVQGTSDSPIVIGALDPSAPPTFTSSSYDRSAGVFVTDSSHLTFRDFAVRRSLWGVMIERSSGVTLERLDVRDLGQEGIRVAERSSWVTIRNSTIADTGRRPGRNSSGQAYANFAEGIYLGTGSTEDDPVNNVVISGNDIFGTGTEAIDIKAPVTQVTVRGNRIHDIKTGTSGAIVVHLAHDQSYTNPGIRIENNEIWNITTSTEWRDGVGIVVGSSIDVRNNTFRNLQHYAIRVEDGGSQGSNITANIEGNSFSGVGIDAIWAVAGRANLQLSGNSGLS